MSDEVIQNVETPEAAKPETIIDFLDGSRILSATSPATGVMNLLIRQSRKKHRLTLRFDNLKVERTILKRTYATQEANVEVPA